MTSPPTCWVCGSTDAALFRESGIDRQLRSDDMRITDSRYGVTVRMYRCRTCEFVFADRDQVRQLVALYQELEDPDYEAGTDFRGLQMARIMDEVLAKRPAAKTLLDVGAGIGLLVHAAKARGLTAEGIEPSQWAVIAGRKRFGATLHAGVFPHEKTSGRSFDIVTLVDVIEHVDDPVELLTSTRRHLAPGGIAVVITPDISSLAAKAFGKRWWHYRLAHVGFFNATSMDRALERAGLRLVQRQRAQWYFTLGYLAKRLAVYIPPLGRASFDQRFFSSWTFPLNLFDSWCFFVTASDSKPT